MQPDAVPTRRYYPDNLFTMLGESYRMTVFGRFLQLCPADACAYDLDVQDNLGDLATDLGIAYLHVVVPPAVEALLPPIVGDWSGFALDRRFRMAEGERQRNERLSELDRFLETITPERSGRLYFLHSLMPHMPFEYVPSGRRYRAPDYQQRRDGGERLFRKSDPWLPVVPQQRHLLQVGVVDRFIGHLMERLRDQGVYDESLIIVTADHGASFQHGSRRREISEDNVADVVLVPLIVKLPHQIAGAISDRNVETVDVVPTISDVLSTTVPYAIDGRSLLDASEPDRSRKTFVQRGHEDVGVVTYAPRLKDRGWEQKLLHFESHLYGLGPHAFLVGRDLSTLDVRAATRTVVRLARPAVFNDVDVEADTLPLHVRGRVTSESTEPVRLAVSVNGVIVATTMSYRENGTWVFASMIPEDSLMAGANEVEIFAVDELGEKPMLRRTRPGRREGRRRQVFDSVGPRAVTKGRRSGSPWLACE